jgi:hypothetical protein
MAEALTQSHCHIRVHHIAMQYDISRQLKARQDADLTRQYLVRPIWASCAAARRFLPGSTRREHPQPHLGDAPPGS